MSNGASTAERIACNCLTPDICGRRGCQKDLHNPMTNRIEELEASKNEALNQLDSALHSVSVLEKRVKSLIDENTDLKAKLAKAVGALDRIAHASDVYGVEANAEDYGADTLAYAHKSTCNLARAALMELTSSVAADDEVKGGKDE